MGGKASKPKVKKGKKEEGDAVVENNAAEGTADTKVAEGAEANGTAKPVEADATAAVSYNHGEILGGNGGSFG